MDEKQLIEKILENNDIAFSILIKKYQGLVFSTCYRLVENRPDAEDLLQDVFIEVYRSLKHLRNVNDMSGWIFKIAYRKSLNFLRKKNPAKASSNTEFSVIVDQIDQRSIVSENETPSEILESNEAKKILFTSIDQLPENQKKALLMHKFEDLSHKEICEKMGLSQSSVESLIYRAKTNLRKSLLNYFKYI